MTQIYFWEYKKRQPNVGFKTKLTAQKEIKPKK